MKRVWDIWCSNSFFKIANFSHNIITLKNILFKRNKYIINGKLAGKPHPKTGIEYNDLGLPKFDEVKVFEVDLPVELHVAQDEKQFKEAISCLSEELKKNSKLI
ncbi:hypothetical protein RW115_07005 [Macrococcus capreoli]